MYIYKLYYHIIYINCLCYYKEAIDSVIKKMLPILMALFQVQQSYIYRYFVKNCRRRRW